LTALVNGGGVGGVPTLGTMMNLDCPCDPGKGVLGPGRRVYRVLIRSETMD